MFKDVIILMSMWALSQGRIVNIAVVSYSSINTTEMLTALTIQSSADFVVVNVFPQSSYHLYQTVIRKVGDYESLIVPGEICNQITIALHNKLKTHPVTCFRSHDRAPSTKLYLPVAQYSTSIDRLMRHLMWSSVSIITDDKHASHSLSVQLSTAGITCSTIVFNSSSTSSDLHDMLQKASVGVYTLHFLLLARTSNALAVLQEASFFDVRNRRRSDMKSSSKWLVVVQEGNLELFHIDMWLDNIAVLVYPAISINTLFQKRCVNFSKGSINTLMYRQSSRELEQIGTFDSNGHIEVKDNIFPNTNYGFNGRLFTVATMLWHPYTYTRNESGKIVFEGIAMDLIKELSIVMNFTCRFVLPPDLVWGDQDSHGNWTGLIGLIQRNEVDIIAAAISSSYDRLAVMDFTYPFGFDNGVGIYKLPDSSADGWLTLIRPFTWSAHLTIASTFIAYSLSLYALRWWHSHLGEEDDMSDTWLVMFGLFIRYSPEINIRAMSSRFLVIFGGLFGTIISAVYCGNMIAFFTVHEKILPFTTISEVVNQSTYKWGTQGNTLWSTSFQVSKDPDFQRFWKGMVNFNKTDQDILHVSEVVHKAKVKRGNYVFVVDSDMLRTWVQEDCSLQLLSDSLHPMRYSLGLPRHSPYTGVMTHWIKQFYDRGLLDIWRRKSVPKYNSCVKKRSIKSSLTSVTIMDLQSAFYILAAGIVAALLTMMMEWRCKRRVLE